MFKIDRFETALAIAGLVILCLVAMATVGAAVIKTERQGRHELRNGAGELQGQYWTHEECVGAIPTPTVGGKHPYTCKAVTYIDVEGSCADAPRPVPATDVVVELRPAVYADPQNNVLDPGAVRLPDGSIEYTFNDVGTLEPRLCPGSDTRYYSVTKVYEQTNDFPTCWRQVEKEATSCSDVAP